MVSTANIVVWDVEEFVQADLADSTGQCWFIVLRVFVGGPYGRAARACMGLTFIPLLGAG